MKRILGVDWGLRRMGLAVSDPMQIIASPAGQHEVRSQAEAVEKVLSAARERDVEAVVVGVPINMDGSQGEMAEAARAFIETLSSRSLLPVHPWDERLTTVQAERALRAGGASRKKRKVQRDVVAAQLILQSFLDAQKLLGSGSEEEEG